MQSNMRSRRNLSFLLVTVGFILACSTDLHAYFRSSSRTSFWAIAKDGDWIWGASTGPNPMGGGSTASKIWRYHTTDASTQMWTAASDIGMTGFITGIIPMTDRILVLFESNGWQGATPADPSAYNWTPVRSENGGIAAFDRASQTWSILNVPVYDIQNYELDGSDLWLTCGDVLNPRKTTVYKLNLSTNQLTLVRGMGDSHFVNVFPQAHFGIVGTHHGRGLDLFSTDSLAFQRTLGYQVVPPPSGIIEKTCLKIASNWHPFKAPVSGAYCGVPKSSIHVGNQLWLIDPMGAYGSDPGRGGLVMMTVPDLTPVFFSASMEQIWGFGDENANGLTVDPSDSGIIWATCARGLFKVHRLENPPRMEHIDMDGVIDQYLPKSTVDAQYVWTGSDLGYLLRYNKSTGVWSECGNFHTGFTIPVDVGPRRIPGNVTALSVTVSGPRVTLSWGAPVNPPARSYYIARDSILIGLSGTTSYVDSNATTGMHTYEVVGCEGRSGGWESRGGLLGTGVSTSATVTAGAAPISCNGNALPDTIVWGTGTMVLLKPYNLYVDKYEFPNRKGIYPLSGVTWPQAKRLAAWQKKRLPTVTEFVRMSESAAGVAWDRNQFDYVDEFRVSGRSTYQWGIYEIAGNLLEWIDTLNPIGDSKSYGLAGGASWAQCLSLGDYQPATEYPAGSWARDTGRFNHSQIGFRCVLDASVAAKLMGLGCGTTQMVPAAAPKRFEAKSARGTLYDMQGRVIYSGIISRGILSKKHLGNKMLVQKAGDTVIRKVLTR